MTKRLVGRVMWVGRATIFLVGLAVILALILGVATTALGATGGQFILGRGNSAETPTSLVSTLADATKSALTVHNKSGGPALNLGVLSGKAPLIVNAGAGTATNLSADELDGKDSSSFANATHAHVGGDITGGTVADDRIDGSIARDGEILPTVRANDGSGSGVDADTIDGKDSTSFFTGQTYVVRQTRSGTTQGAAINLEMKCQTGDKVLSGGLSAPFGGTILRDAPGKVNSWGGVDFAQNGDSPDAWVVNWVPNYDSNYSTHGYAVCADLN